MLVVPASHTLLFWLDLLLIFVTPLRSGVFPRCVSSPRFPLTTRAVCFSSPYPMNIWSVVSASHGMYSTYKITPRPRRFHAWRVRNLRNITYQGRTTVHWKKIRELVCYVVAKSLVKLMSVFFTAVSQRHTQPCALRTFLENTYKSYLSRIVCVYRFVCWKNLNRINNANASNIA